MLLWSLFSREEFKRTINKYNNLSAPSPDKILWKHLKLVFEDNKYLRNIINIANACIDLGYWPTHFKMSLSIIISKPNKDTYNSSKLFHPIVLLNTLGKLIEKVISERLQFYLIVNFIHPNQLSELKQWLTTDTEVYLIHIICSG